MENIPNLSDCEFESKGADDVTVDEEGGNMIELLKSSLEDKTTVDESITSLPMKQIDVRCEPVIDILYAKVFVDSDTSVDVYGDIRIYNFKASKHFIDSERDRSKDFIVYERHRFDNPQRIYPKHNFLQLFGPDEIPTLNEPFVVVDIHNVDTGDVIASGRQILLKTTHQPYHIFQFERITTLQFCGDDGGRVELQYVAFTFGVYARVQMFLYKDDDPSVSHKINKDEDDDEQGVEIFGMICAKCNPLLLPKGCYENHMFNVIKEEHEWVGLGTEIDLFKTLVAVPAYSELEISVDLKGYKDDGFIVQGTACFEPTNYNGGWKDVRGVNGFYVRVHVEWCEPSLLNEPCCDEDAIDDVCSVPRCPQLYASQLLEVFSLFIARPNCKKVNLYGTVKIFDSRGCCTVFSCSKNEAYFLSGGRNLLPMQGPKRVVTPGSVFSIEIDLSDVDGHVNIKGFAQSTYHIEELQRPWFDRRLCSVVGGANEKSFAAVNYTLFSFAVEASLTVRLKCRSSARVKIYGDITASYSNISSSTIYNMQFFQITLFTRGKVNPLVGEENFELSRNLLAVPIDFSLLMEVNLSFQTSEGTHRVWENVKFQIGEPCIAIKRDSIDICIDVKWNCFPYV